MRKRIFLVLLLLFYFAYAQQNQQMQDSIGGDDYFASIGEFITGRINTDKNGITLHNYQLDQEISKKYLFFRFSSNSNLDSPLISIYDYDNRSLIQDCLSISVSDYCYISRNQLHGGQKIVVVVSGRDDITYNLQTYWGDLQHIQPNTEIKFYFNSQDKTQLFHFELKQKQQFEQVRIILAPETSRANFDQVKIYANYDINNQPTVQKHDLQSVHIWGDAEAIFLSKSQIMGKKGIILYIVGSSQTIYTLNCEIINETHHDIELNEVISQYLSGQMKQQSYHIQFDHIDNSNVDEYSFKFSVFSGEIAVQLYTDKQFKNKYDREPLQYMNDLEFIFSKDEFREIIKELYIRVLCPDATAIYQLELQGRKDLVAFKMTENIYEFSMMTEGRKGMYFQYPIFNAPDLLSTKNGEYIFQINAIRVRGQVLLNFYVCTEDIQNWINCLQFQTEQFEKSVEQIKQVTEQVGKNRIYTLSVNQKYFKGPTDLEKTVMVIITATHSNDDKQLNLIALQYSNPNKVKPLRVDHPIQQKIFSKQTKVYKYINNDPTVSSIQIYINDISGLAKISATRSDPRLTGQPSFKEQNHGSFQFNEDITKPVYIVARGVVNSIYVIGVVVKHKSHPQSQSFTLVQDIPYTFNIDPYSSLNVLIHPIDGDIQMKYKSKGGPISICQVDFYGICKSDKQLLANNSIGSFQVNGNQRSIRYKIANGFNPLQQIKINGQNATIPNRINVQITYHQINMHCDEKTVNQVYSEVMKGNDCIQFHLPTPGQFEIMLRKSNIGKITEYISLCSQPMTQQYIRDDRLIITRQQFNQKCVNQNDGSLTIMFIGNAETIRYQYSVQYKSNPITLKDGVSYTAKGVSISDLKPIRYFFYQITETSRDIEIILMNKKGAQTFYGDIIDDQAKLIQYVTNSKFNFSSIDNKYSKNPQLKISSEDIANYPCKKNCVLVISVYSTSNEGSQVQFALEITSTSIVLRQDEIRTDFVGKNQLKYYEYENSKQNGSLVIKVSDNNKYCSQIYISKKQFPSDSNNIQKASGDLILDSPNKDIYYIGVEGTQNCQYSISISQSNSKITRMKYGEFYDLSLAKGEKKAFLVQHIASQPFKVLSLEKHGSIKIYANQTQLTNKVIKQIENDSIQFQKFNFISSYKNTLIVSDKNPGFCGDCFYLLIIKAQIQTETSIILVGQNAKIHINSDKKFFDEIQDTNVLTLATYHIISDGNLIVNVHSGSINLEMSYLNQTKISKVFTQNKKPSTQVYNFTKDQSSNQLIQIKITGVKVPAQYSLQLQPNISNERSSIKLTPGEHSYLNLNGINKQCVTGSLRKRDQLIYLTVNLEDTFKLERLNIEPYVNNQTNKITKQVVGNIISIKFDFDSIFFKDVQEYKICFSGSLDEILQLVVFQNQKISILPTSTQVLIQKKQNIFLLHPNGDLIIDIFKCSGEPNIKYSSNLTELPDAKSHTSDSIGIPGQNHAIRLQATQTIYLSVKAEQATMLWMNLNPQKEKGVGYFKYTIGSLQYANNFNRLDFTIGGVTPIKQTKTKVQSINYTLYLADSKVNLQEAVMCEKFNTTKVLKFTIRILTDEDIHKKKVYLPINKKQIAKTFTQNATLYYNVVADMILKPPIELQQKPSQLEHYRFIYYEQQITSEIFTQTTVESLNVGMIILVIIVGVIGFFIVACIFVKLIVPGIGKLKSRIFVEEAQDPRDQSIPVPQTSERNQIQ